MSQFHFAFTVTAHRAIASSPLGVTDSPVRRTGRLLRDRVYGAHATPDARHPDRIGPTVVGRLASRAASIMAILLVMPCSQEVLPTPNRRPLMAAQGHEEPSDFTIAAAASPLKAVTTTVGQGDWVGPIVLQKSKI
jgi:hypothetical protein